MTPLETNRYWQRADAPGRAALLQALATMQVGQRLRVADVTRAAPTGTDDQSATEGSRAGDAPPLVEYTSTAIRAAEIDPETREVQVSFSSETPCARWWGIEVLGHDSGEVDMSWMASGRAPVLADHFRDIQIGVVRSAWIGRDRRGYALWRFGKSARAEQEMQDAIDGVRTNVSVGYEIRELELVKQEGEERTYRVTEWCPLENSSVSIPADMSVGIGRDAADNPPAQPQARTIPATPKGPTVTTTTLTAEDLERARQEAREQAVKDEQQRTKLIMELGTRHNLRPIAEKAVADGINIELFRGLMLDELHKRTGEAAPLYQPPHEIGLTKKEAESFSVARYMRSLIDRDPTVAPFETACAKTVRNAMDKVGYQGRGKGNYLPLELMRQPLPGVRVVDGQLMVGDRVIAGQRDLSTGAIVAGGAMVATDLLAADFITLLRNASLLRRMGVRVLSGLVGNIAIPRQTGTVTAGWVAQGGPATESDATFNQVTMSPKTAHAIQDVTRDMLLQATPAVEGVVRADLIDSMATQLDFVGLHGTGASNQPTGLANTAGIGAVAGGTDGLAPNWDHVVGLETAVANNNAAQGSVGYLTNTRVRGRLKRTQKFTGTNGQEVWMPPMAGDDPGTFGMLNGYRAGVSNNVRSDLTKGTSNGICSGIFFGNWSDLLIGEWGAAEILPDELTQAANRIVRMHIYQTIDIAVRRAQSFSAMLDALTT